MRHFKSVYRVLLILSALSFPPPLFAGTPDVKKLERQSIMYRLEHTKCGFIRMRVIHEIDPSQQAEFLYKLTFDENRIQQIRRCRLLGQEKWCEPEKTVITPKHYINDVEYIDTPVQVASASSYKDPREHFGVLNPRILGMVRGGTSLLQLSDIEDLLNRFDSAFATVHPAQHDGIDAWRIDYKQMRNEELDVSIWIVPNQGFSVARIELRLSYNEIKMMQTVDSRLKQYPEGSVWYPERVVTEETTEDGRIISRQVAIIDEARFGGSIKESDFTLAGLDLKPGRQIVDSTSGRPWGKVWNGKEAVDPSGVKTASPNPTRHRRPRWLLLSLAAPLGLLSLIYFWRVIKQRRSGSNPGA